MKSMRRLPLAASLAILTVGVVLLLVGALAPAALSLFARLAEENASARVRLAALGAADRLESEAVATQTAAELLAERPTLLRLVSAGNDAALTDFLERFRSTGELHGCAVFHGDRLLAAAPSEIPWRTVAPGVPEGKGSLTELAGGTGPAATGSAELAGNPGYRVLVLRWLDQAVAERLGQQMALAVTIGSGEDSAASIPGTEAPLTTRVPVGDGDLWVEASVPPDVVDRTLQPLRRTFIWVALGTSLLAMAVGAWVGHRLSAPLATMQRAAQRIGAGDLASPVPAVSGAETSALATTLEDMRRRLRTLTTQLRHREAEAQALLSGIVEGVFAVDEDRRIRYLNQQAAALLGVSVEQVVGRFCGDVLQARDTGGHPPCEERCPIVHARSRGSSRTVEHLHLPGGRRTVVITSAPPAGDVQVQVLRDETETEAARRSRDAVLANVSHELKTPLSAQLASIELLRDGLDGMDSAAAAELLASLERSTLRLTRLVDNLLESVRIETGRTSLRHGPIDLRQLLDEALAMTRPLFEQRGQQIDNSALSDNLQVIGDSSQLTQVMVNLLANAQKYAPEDSKVQIGASCDAEWVEVWVEDQGPGVPAALSDSIFDRFHRESAEGEGMGLGLWIAKSVIERHGGQIAVSQSDLGGARFSFRLPRGETG